MPDWLNLLLGIVAFAFICFMFTYLPTISDILLALGVIAILVIGKHQVTKN